MRRTDNQLAPNVMEWLLKDRTTAAGGEKYLGGGMRQGNLVAKNGFQQCRIGAVDQRGFHLAIEVIK